MSENAYISEGSRIHPLPKGETIIGRQEPSDLVFPFPQISRQHAKLARGPKGYLISDLESRFGTFVNGQQVTGDPRALRDGDEIVLAGVLSLKFSDPSETRDGRRIGRLKGVWIDELSQEVWIDGHQVVPPLSAPQLLLLRHLEEKRGAFVSREEIVGVIWPDVTDGVSEEAIDGLIKRLRGRLRETARDPIEVRRGVGLRLEA